MRGHRTERRVFDATGSVLTHGPRARLSNGPRSASSDGKVCMAEVCLTAPAVLSPISPNERRKRRHGYDSHVAEGCGANWYKRHRTGHSFVRKLLHLRGFSLNVQQAEELVRFIDQFPAEMDKDVSSILEKCGDIDDAIRQLTSLKLTAERKAAAAEAATTVTDDAGDANGQAQKEKHAATAEDEARRAVEAAEQKVLSELCSRWVNLR